MVATVQKGRKCCSDIALSEITHRQSESANQLRERARRLRELEVGFVDHAWFHRSDAETRIEELKEVGVSRPRQIGSPAAGIAFVSGLVAENPLSASEERYLFTRMNFLRFRAAAGRQRLNLRRPSQRLVEQIERDLAESNELRNRIVQANLRLVVSVARKLAGSLDQLSELISEGLLPLIRAVELFNISLGNRFSTYATWAVRNQMLRSLKKKQHLHEFDVKEGDLLLSQLPDLRDTSVADLDESPDPGPLLGRLMGDLPERERAILAARFGLNGHPEGQSLAELSAQFGLSKERVRQIALKALTTLQRRVAGWKER